MTKNKKIIFSVLAVLLLIYFLPIFGLEKSLIRNEIAKSTREPILGKHPVRQLIGSVLSSSDKNISIIDEKNVSHYITDENISKLQEEKEDVIVFEPLGYLDVSMDDIKNIDIHTTAYTNYVEKGYNTAYFKPDFTELFKKRIGDKVTLIFDNIEYEGYVIDTGEEAKKLGMEYDYFYIIKPKLDPCEEDDYNCDSNFIRISGYKDNNFFGVINYRNINGGVNYTIEANNGIGIIVESEALHISLGIDRLD